LGEKDAIAYLMQCARAGDALAGLGAAPDIEPMLRAAMGLPEGAVEDYLALHCADDRFDCDVLQAIAAANRSWGSATGNKVADSVERWLALDPVARSLTLPDLALLVFTGAGDPRSCRRGDRRSRLRRHGPAAAAQPPRRALRPAPGPGRTVGAVRRRR
jgi:ATP-dependent helicase/nuclease subunit A